MEIRDIKALRKYIDGKIETILDGMGEIEIAADRGFPFITEFQNSYLVSDTALSIPLSGASAGHYLVYFRTYDNTQLALFESQSEGAEVDSFNFVFMTEEIDLFYRPYDTDPEDPQAVTKVFGLENYVKPDENDPGKLIVAPPAAGETGVCLVFKIQPSTEAEDYLSPLSFE